MELPDRVESREELIAHVRLLLDDLNVNETEWENANLGDFLEALAAWLDDCPGHYSRDPGRPIDPDRPSWQVFADALSAARAYE